MTSEKKLSTSALGLMLAAMLLQQACHTAKQHSPVTEDDIIVAVSKAIRQAHLTKEPDECLAYDIDSSAADAYLVEVRENHSHARCGGDPQTEPRLFTVRVDRKTQSMSSDNGSPGEFHPVRTQ